MTPSRNVDRRDFLKTSAGAAISAGLWSSGAAAAESTSANEKLNIACIGTANRAAADIEGVRSEHIVALCDVDDVYLQRQLGNFPTARTYNDFRDLIDQEADKIDAVTIATADHTHGPAAIRAIRKGLHVYVEKPLTHTIHEARVITEAAREAGVATQLGTQVHASDNYRRVVEIIQSGAIGDVTEAHVWVGKHWGGGERPEGGQEPPKNLHWDLWIGPAPERPFFAGRYHPAQWRRWWDFGTGTLGDMACHFMDLPFWALDLKYPTHCSTEGPAVHPETCPIGLTVHLDFPQRDSKPPVKLTWYDGNMIPQEIHGQRVPKDGVMFVGSEGMMFADYSKYRLFPQDKFQGFEPPEQTIPASIGHHAEWIKACKEGTPTLCNFDYSGPLTEAVLLGNIAYRCEQPIEWDAENLTCPGCPEADMYIRKEYREGWEVV
ncbi:MAG: Gfo/Idh/MocA family oxidoreductase [Planctomycetaceae bacterium]|nr:Gfo/Idh/MocA family oxidoreductase [Planctomycetaceae bacterium]